MFGKKEIAELEEEIKDLKRDHGQAIYEWVTSHKTWKDKADHKIADATKLVDIQNAKLSAENETYREAIKELGLQMVDTQELLEKFMEHAGKQCKCTTNIMK